MAIQVSNAFAPRPEMKLTRNDKGFSRATLDRASIGQALTVKGVQAPPVAPEWARWLEEVGFIVGEQVMLMARAMPGGDPLVVRVGQSTFALRGAEAACVHVESSDRANRGEGRS